MEFKGTTEKLHAVTYAGIVFIQDSEFYEDSEKCNVLDADHVGLVQAEANGLLFSKSNDIVTNLNISTELLKSILVLFESNMALSTKFGIVSQIDANESLIKEATEI